MQTTSLFPSSIFNDDYALLDSGAELKLERFGRYVLQRPCSQAVWLPRLTAAEWQQQADASFSRDPYNHWVEQHPLPSEWTISVAGIKFKLSSTDFGHLGIFPEQRPFWQWMTATLQRHTAQMARQPQVLNLFAYSGGATLAAAKGGAAVCHLDASKGMVAWARENAALNGLEKAPIRWIVDDVTKFLKRELRRGHRYDAIILDPPTFGRGSQGEIFKIEESIVPILELCRSLLSDTPLFLLFSCHTPGFTPVTMEILLRQVLGLSSGTVDAGEMLLTGNGATFPIPSGTYVRWQNGG